MVLVSSSIFLLIADWESFSLSNSSLRSPGKWIHLFNDVSRDVPAIIRHVVAWIYLKVLAEMLVPSCGRIAPRSKLHYFSPQIWNAYGRSSDPYSKVLPLILLSMSFVLANSCYHIIAREKRSSGAAVWWRGTVFIIRSDGRMIYVCSHNNGQLLRGPNNNKPDFRLKMSTKFHKKFTISSSLKLK